MPKYKKCSECKEQFNIYECFCQSRFDNDIRDKELTAKHIKNIYWGDGITVRGTELDIEAYLKEKHNRL